jgi:hypothetical protein
MEKAQELSAVWRNRLEVQRGSGLSIAAWCKQEGVSAWSFYAWRKRLAEPAPCAPLIAVPLSAMAPAPMLEMQTPGGYVLRLSSAEQVGWLPAILASVR